MFRRLYYNKETGASIMTYSTSISNYKKPSFGQDKKTYSHFDGVKDSAIDWIDFENGEYESDFMEAASFKVNLETKLPEFTYRAQGDAQPIAPSVPFSVQVDNLVDQVKKLEARLAKLETK